MSLLKVNTVSGIGTEGIVINGGLKFRSLSYMTLPKVTHHKEEEVGVIFNWSNSFDHISDKLRRNFNQREIQ